MDRNEDIHWDSFIIGMALGFMLSLAVWVGVPKPTNPKPTVQLQNVNQEVKQPVKAKSLMMTVTAYDPGPKSCGKWAKYGLTKTGKRARRGIIAVDPKVIPFHTLLFVPGYGYGVAEDTGSAIKGNHIDVCFPSYRQAKQWGRRRLKVNILETIR
jgi:3D (Asp-Asp-Asp) domain-containing protein